MAAKRAFWVIGGDSLVGCSVMRALDRRGHVVLASTRRRETLRPHRIYLDFTSGTPIRAPDAVDHAFVIAAATRYERCETDPLAQVVNVEAIPRAAAALLEQGLFVTFISTNAVFGGERPWPGEDDPHDPQIAYARQKSEGERVIRTTARRLNALPRLSIVRLTKVMGANVSPIPVWLAAWRRGEAVEAFSDLVFAPISERFVGEALATLGDKRMPGNLHLSGAENITYVDFAHALARRLRVDPGLIRPTTAVAKGVCIPFKPRYSGLGMLRTTEVTGLRPQRLADLVEDLAAEPELIEGLDR